MGSFAGWMYSGFFVFVHHLESKIQLFERKIIDAEQIGSPLLQWKSFTLNNLIQEGIRTSVVEDPKKPELYGGHFKKYIPENSYNGGDYFTLIRNGLAHAQIIIGDNALDNAAFTMINFVEDKEGNKPFDSDISDFKSEKLRRDQVYLWNGTTDEGKRTRNFSLRCPVLDFSVMLVNVLVQAYKFVEKLQINRGLRICGYGPCLSKFESSTNQFIHVCREVYYCSKECQSKHLWMRILSVRKGNPIFLLLMWRGLGGIIYI